MIMDGFNYLAFETPIGVPVNKENIRQVTDQEIRESGILQVVSEVADLLRQKYLERASHAKPKEINIYQRVYRDLVAGVMDRMVESLSSASSPDAGYDEMVDYLSCHAYGGVAKYEFFEDAVSVTLHDLVVTLQSDGEMGVSEVAPPGKYNFGFKWYSGAGLPHLKAVVLLDAVMDGLKDHLASIVLEVESACKAQDIYQAFADNVARSLTGRYSGPTKVSHKPNRMSVHFYLSETEKAFITFYKDQMPWVLPEPPVDPESLRETCMQESSPFFIVSLSKKDRRHLKK